MEEDIKVLKEFIRIDRLMRSPAEDYSDYDEFCERRCVAIENLLKEREQDKARIKELEEMLNSKISVDLSYKDYISKQKIQDKIDYLQHEYFKREQILLRRDKVIKGQIKVLQELLKGEK